MRLRLKNFLGLREIDWSPTGVALVAGPNGAGKTSLLDALQFLANAYRRNVADAARTLGGQAFKFVGAPADEPVSLSIEVTLDEHGPQLALPLDSQAHTFRWELDLDARAGGIEDFPAERLYVDDVPLYQRVALSPSWRVGDVQIDDDPEAPRRTCLRTLYERRLAPAVDPFTRFIQSVRVYDAWWLRQLRERGSHDEVDAYLHATGRNLFSVLRSWRSEPRRYRNQFDWVRAKAREAFFDVFEDLEIASESGFVVARIFPPGFADDQGLPVLRAPDGLLTGLLHLTAVAGARDGSVIALDEMENQLHPHAIRVILSAMRELAEERDLTIVLTSHSPVVMNEFRHDMESFFVLERGVTPGPRRITKLHDPGWLAQFSLGDLYETLRVGQPHPPSR